jgi:integrase
MRWSLFQEKGVWVIRRWEGGKYKRLPVKRYRSIRGDYEKLSEFVKRLNAPIDAKEVVDYKHAFISPSLLEEYREYLLAKIPTLSDALCEFAYLNDYCLNFFIGKLNLKGIEEWHRAHETKWAAYLLGQTSIAAPTTKRKVVMAMNRFAKWLHKKRPEDTPLLEFEPISPAKYRQIEAQWELDHEGEGRTFIPDADWGKIEAKLPPTIAPFALFAYYYGLRRNETLGLKPGDVRRDYLSVERQLKKLGVYAPLKGRTKRKVPHWAATPTQAYQWLVDMSQKLVHPRTLSERWAEYMKCLNFKYDFHDLRHTFITKMIRGRDPRDVQLAAGHKNIATTMAYLHDDRTLGDEEFKPTG